MAQKRYTLIDSLRGISIISMILYHMVYDFRFVFGIPMPHYSPLLDVVWQQSICWTFILLSGMCRHFSHRHLRRGLTVLGSGLLVTWITVTAMPEQAIHFGVLSFVGCSILLCIPLLPFLEHIPPKAGAAGCFALFLLLYGVPRGYLGISGYGPRLPAALYQFRVLAPLGLPDPDFWSSDYFPLLPWFFLFLTGYFLWLVVEQYPKLNSALTVRLPVAHLIGRYSLPIYLLHQPLLMALLTTAFRRW